MRKRPRLLEGGYVQIKWFADKENNMSGGLGARAAALACQALRDRYVSTTECVLRELDTNVERLGDFYVLRDLGSSTTAPTKPEPASTTRTVGSMVALERATNDDDFWVAVSSSPGLSHVPDHEVADSQSITRVDHDPYFAALDDASTELGGLEV